MSALLRNQASFARAALVSSSRVATIQAPRAVTLPMVTRALSSTKNPAAGGTATEVEFSDSDKSNSNTKDSSNNKPLGKVSGIVNSILHGSGTLPKIQSQESWGVSLARGKYVHELQSKQAFMLAFLCICRNLIFILVANCFALLTYINTGHRIRPERFDDYVQLVYVQHALFSFNAVSTWVCSENRGARTPPTGIGVRGSRSHASSSQKNLN